MMESTLICFTVENAWITWLLPMYRPTWPYWGEVGLSKYTAAPTGMFRLVLTRHRARATLALLADFRGIPAP